ncbi:hypothetical protein [Sinorhizobium americanum]|nr:hypothetical protein [Sinorhizobium americanum]
MDFPKLGRLVTLSAKNVWIYEAQTFTPWLAENPDLQCSFKPAFVL